ncbi:pheromone processing endoprotease [Kappamyces sp. JEL0680]|nr:pheromone processing endoprotease [Kappamyces sp. JEL0680]
MSAASAKRDFENFYYFAVQKTADADIADIALQMGAKVLHGIGALEDHFLLQAPRSSPGHSLHKRMAVHPDITWVEEQQAYQHLYKRDEAAALQSVRKSLNLSDPGFAHQWHLLNTASPGFDMNVTGVWRMGRSASSSFTGITGTNVTVGFLDDGLDHENADLKENFSLEGSWDFNEHKQLPTPSLWDDTHGTRCAGEVAAAKNNVCGVGVAYTAKVAGIRILSGLLTNADEAAAVTFGCNTTQIYSCSWGPRDDGRTMESPPEIVAKAFDVGIKSCRGGLGSIYVFAAGNGGSSYDNWYAGRNSCASNFDGYTNSIYTITVAAMDNHQNHPPYSERCSAILISMYSSHGPGMEGIYTSDWKDGCTDRHGGTSAAAPLASGVYALLLSQRPDLNWRDVQRLTVENSIVVNPNDPDWRKNGVSRMYNHKYGYGTFDSYKLLQAAKRYVTVGPQTSIRLESQRLNKTIPQDSTGISHSINVDHSVLASSRLYRLEHVQVQVFIEHQRRGDISIQLVSPSNSTSTLVESRKFDDSAAGFPGDENPAGNWTIRVIDNENLNSSGSFLSWKLILWGEQAPASNATLPTKSLPPVVPVQTSAVPTLQPDHQTANGSNKAAVSSTPLAGSTLSGSVGTTGQVVIISLAFITALVASVWIAFRMGWYKRQKVTLEGQEDHEMQELENLNDEEWNEKDFDNLAFTDTLDPDQRDRELLFDQAQIKP